MAFKNPQRIAVERDTDVVVECLGRKVRLLVDKVEDFSQSRLLVS